MAKKIKEDDAIEVKPKKDMSSKDQKDVKDSAIEESDDYGDGMDWDEWIGGMMHNAPALWKKIAAELSKVGVRGAPDEDDLKDPKVVKVLDKYRKNESANVEDDKKGAVVVATEDDDDTDDKKVVVKEKKSIKESTDHIVGIVSSGKLHLLEDGIMGVINSKLVEKLDAAKAQIKAKAVFKGA